VDQLNNSTVHFRPLHVVLYWLKLS